MFVRPFITAYLNNRSKNFSEILYEVEGKKCKKHSTAPFWSQVANRRVYIESLSSVRACVMAYLKNRSKDFSEIWYEVEGKKCKKHSMAAFLKKISFSRKPLICVKNIDVRGKFDVIFFFGEIAKKTRLGLF